MRTAPSPADRLYWRLAWLCFLLAIPLRLAFFAGFGLGDDPNESIALQTFAHQLELNPGNFMHYRVVNVLMRGMLFRFFPGNELAFVLPVFVFALGTHAATIGFARDLFGSRFAFLTSLLFLATPFETLASTANVPDYFHAFFGVAAAWAAYRGVARGRSSPMVLAAALLTLAFLSRLFAILMLPAFGVATLLRRRDWRRWAVFWTSFAVFVALVCVWDRYHSGDPFGWILKSSGGFGGHDVTDVLGYVLMVYPRYLFGHDDLQHRMFGLTGWCAAAGALVALGRAVRGRASAGEAVLLIGFFVLGGLFEFLPHRPSLTAYWSHPRIFRYMAQIVPVVYLCAAYFLHRLWDVPRRSPVGIGLLLCIGVVGYGLYETPRVAGPLVDSAADGRWLVRYLREHAGKETVQLYLDFWRVDLLLGRYPDYAPAWQWHGVRPDSKDDKVAFLRSAPPGAVVVTGGASLPWYSGIDLITSISRLPFTVPDNWTLLAERDGEIQSWRAEPMRLWSVGPRSAEPAATPPAS